MLGSEVGDTVKSGGCDEDGQTHEKAENNEKEEEDKERHNRVKLLQEKRWTDSWSKVSVFVGLQNHKFYLKNRNRIMKLEAYSAVSCSFCIMLVC